jgi:serine protease AprX
MPMKSVLLEFEAAQPEAFAAFSAASESAEEAVSAAESLLDPVAGLGVELEEARTPVPMFSVPDVGEPMRELAGFSGAQENEDVSSATSVVAARVPDDRFAQLVEHPGVRVWPNSELTLIGQAEAPPAVDCKPYEPAVPMVEIEAALGVQALWDAGHTGKGIVVGIVDEGVDGSTYPVKGGFSPPGFQAPGEAEVISHGSMCAADVLLAAPDATLYDYPFLGPPRSGDALEMFQAVLDQRRIDGTPHLTNNSYGFTAVPARSEAPDSEIWDLNHPLHRKVREVVASGAAAFFAAGNCGADCPTRRCDRSGIGPGKSIHASNSLAEVITVAAVNRRGTRIGYSSQGPGMFESRKPDIASYSHFFGNFGEGRPAGTHSEPFDSGTSAATPVACGVAALLLNANPAASPAALKAALIGGAEAVPSAGWDADLGHGIVHAGGALNAM